jgi:formylmethanofuran dehydrogenase subunit E
MEFYNNPREEIHQAIKAENTNLLMQKAAQMHGHYCPGLALGVLAATKAMNLLLAESDGLEDLLAITETNNCFSDGIQFVTGCSFGNNALIYKDFGKTAFSLVYRSGKGVRINTKHNSQDVIRASFPDSENLYQKVIKNQERDSQLVEDYKKWAFHRAFGTLTLPFDLLFDVRFIEINIPDYAKINKSVVCKKCNESIMDTRAINNEADNFLCIECGDYSYNMLDGNGIHHIELSNNKTK